MIYRCRFPEVDAIQFHGKNVKEVKAWLGDEYHTDSGDRLNGRFFFVSRGKEKIAVPKGDWLIRTAAGVLRFTSDEFKWLFEAVVDEEVKM